MSECKTDDVEEALIAKGYTPAIYCYDDKLPKKIFYIASYQKGKEEIFLLLNIETGGFILVKPKDDKKKA